MSNSAKTERLSPTPRVRSENSAGSRFVSLDLASYSSASHEEPRLPSPAVLLVPSNGTASIVELAPTATPVNGESPTHPSEGDSKLPTATPISHIRSIEFALRSAEVNRRLFPGWGLLCSLLLHSAAIFALIFFRPVFYNTPYEDSPTKWELTIIPKEALYLPALGGGDTGLSAGRAAREGTKQAQTSAAPARSTAGVSYPGPQPIVSNPPRPTNRIQTILQPELIHPPTLKGFVPLPNMVKLAQPSPEPLPPGSVASAKPEPEPVDKPRAESASAVPTPVVAPPAVPPLQAPKLTLPVQPPSTANIPLEAMTRPPVAAPAAQSKAPSAKPQVLPGAEGRDLHSLLSVSVMPAPPQPAPPKLPAGEARGQFAIAALPNLATSKVGPGSVGAGVSPDTIGLGTHPDNSGHDVTGDSGANSGSGSVAAEGKARSSSGSGEAALSIQGGMTGSGSGTGVRVAYGVGSGPGAGTGSGSGAGAGPGRGAFPGITIQGGEWPSGQPSDLKAHQPASNQQSGFYGLTVVSTGNSGGGLGDFGVFYDEPVFTVYIDMTTSPGDVATSWTMEYAALHRGEVSADLAPPFPLKKEMPGWPTELASRYLRQVVVAFVVIDAQGNVLEVKSMQSPNVGFVGPLLSALAKWQFRPALAGGKPVAVRVLIGAPIIATRPKG